MATQQQRFVTVARTGLTLAAAFGLARVFPGGSWVVPVAVAAIVPVVLFAVAERYHWHAVWAFLAVAAAGVWLAVLVDTPSETILGIPTPGGFGTFGSDLANAPHVLRSAVVPVRPVGAAALVLAVVTTYIAAALTDVVARRLDAPLGAIGPSIALFIALASLGSGKWAPVTAMYALVVVAYLVAVHAGEVATRRTWFQSQRTRRSQVLWGGLAGGALIVALAIALGPAVPGARGAAWINYRKLGSGNGASVLHPRSPLVSIHSRLNEQSEDVVFSVLTSNKQPYEWRAVALDDLDRDGNWVIAGHHGDRASADTLPKATHKPGTTLVNQRFSITAAADPYWLPAAYRPIGIDLDDASVLPASDSLFLSKEQVAGVKYSVNSEITDVSTADLQAVTMADLDALSDRTVLPRDFPKKVREKAESLTANATTPYEKAVALERFFQSDLFTYDKTVNYGTTPNALEKFIFDQRRGFCEQFATAYALMARSIGLPARVAVGFKSQGAPDRDGAFQVRGKDAHAWPEVWLGHDIGWYAFEPTKGQFNGQNGRGNKDAATGVTTPTTQVTPTTTPSGTTSADGSKPIPKEPNQINTDPGSATKTGSGGGLKPAQVLLGVLVALLVGAVAALVILTAMAWQRTRRRRTATDPRRRVFGAWSEALERLAAAGVTPRPSATPIEFALRHAPAHGAGDAGPPLMDLARLQTAAVYAPDPPSADDANAAWKAVDDINGALRHTVVRSERWIARLRLRRRDRRST
jgi:transglutaminase-like putative cysteine protease